MRSFFAIAAVTVCGVLGRPSPATAQFFVNPFVDTTLSSPSGSGASSKPGWGVAFGTAGRIVGVETEIAYHPALVDNAANGLDKNRVITYSGNTIIGPTIRNVKPYGAIGFGGLYLNVTSASSLLMPSLPTPANAGATNPAASISSNYFTFNAGGGVMVFFNEHLGVRGDLRYFRAYGFKVTDLENAGLGWDRFDFWRVGIGLAAKF
jgi:opacity protein-like surface antigen